MKDQRVVALAKANAIRGRRATLKKELFALPLEESRRRAAELLLRPPEWLRTMDVLTLLKATNLCGPARARRMFLRPAGVPEQRLIGDLTPREVNELVPRLRMTSEERAAESSRKWRKAA